MNFLYYFPDSTIYDIADNSDASITKTRKVMTELIRRGDVVSKKSGRIWLYSVSPGYQPVNSKILTAAHPAALKEIAKCEQTVNSLLSRGLRRRALTELRRLSALQTSARGIEAVAKKAARI